MITKIYPKPVTVVLRIGHFGPGIYDHRFLIRFNGNEWELGSNVRDMEKTIRACYDTQAASPKRVFKYYPEHEYIGRPDFTKAIN